MATKRIHELTEQALPASGDYVVVDKSGNDAAVKMPLANLLVRVDAVSWVQNRNYVGLPIASGLPYTVGFSTAVDASATMALCHIKFSDEDQTGNSTTLQYRPKGEAQWQDVVRLFGANSEAYGFAVVVLGTNQEIEIHTSNGPTGSSEVDINFYVVGWV